MLMNAVIDHSKTEKLLGNILKFGCFTIMKIFYNRKKPSNKPVVAGKQRSNQIIIFKFSIIQLNDPQTKCNRYFDFWDLN